MTPRIISLIASATEIVYALGYGEHLVGRSHECDFPNEVKTLPVCTSPKFEPDGTSYEIDQRVKAILQEAVSVYRVDAELLDSLDPSHLITQAQCEVCAVSLKDVQDAACKLIHSNPTIVSLQPNSLDDIWEDISRVGRSLKDGANADKCIDSLKKRILQIRNAVNSKARPTVALIEWIDPLMAGGNWMPELIELAGAINLFGVAGEHSPWMEWEDLLRRDPDFIIVSPCGFDIPRTMQEMNLLTEKKGYQNLKAVKHKQVFVADGNQYFNRPGPRVVESLEILSEIFHPKSAGEKYEGLGWVRYNS